MPLLLIQAAVQDSSAIKIPSFTDRLNFALPIIVILLIVTFFLLLKSYSMNNASTPGGHTETKRGKNTVK
ncbi:MAG: hypothetical protein M1469_04025 [Bacteroidetes bacterium]|nr:hypothetical protein [Bacteroidota bacterium]